MPRRGGGFDHSGRRDHLPRTGRIQTTRGKCIELAPAFPDGQGRGTDGTIACDYPGQVRRTTPQTTRLSGRVVTMMRGNGTTLLVQRIRTFRSPPYSGDSGYFEVSKTLYISGCRRLESPVANSRMINTPKQRITDDSKSSRPGQGRDVAHQRLTRPRSRRYSRSFPAVIRRRRSHPAGCTSR